MSSGGITPVTSPPPRFSVDRHRGRLITGVALLVLCVLAATLGANLGHREPARLTGPARATGGELTFVLTRDFVRSLDVSDSERLGFRNAVNLVDVGNAPSGVLAGRVPHPGALTLLPRGLTAGRRQEISLDGVRGWRYPDVAVPGRTPHAEITAVPAAAGGSIVVICDVPVLRRADCRRLLAGVHLAGATADRAARGVAGVLVPQMRRLRAVEARLSATVASARTAHGREVALRGLGAAYARTAAALRGIPAATALSRALYGLAAAYGSLARATRSGTRAGVIFARSEVSNARARVARSFRIVAARAR